MVRRLRDRLAQPYWMAALCLPPLAAIAVTWLPVASHYWAREPSIDTLVIEKARTQPNDELLEAIAPLRVYAQPRGAANREVVLRAAESAMRNEYVSEHGEALRYSPTVGANDLEKGAAVAQLAYAGLALPDALLKGYEATRDRRFLDRAIEIAIDWDALESQAWMPRGFLWNDHATAERVYVLVDLWRAYRKSGAFRDSVDLAILRQLARATALLAKEGHYTPSTNHGVMQNLALLHAGLAVPMLPEVASRADVARARALRQMKFFISHDGAVLEHAPSYHRFGVALAAMLVEYLKLRGDPIPTDFAERYERARAVYRTMLRPDLTLPQFGDTRNATLENVDGAGGDGAIARSRLLDRWVPDRCTVLPVGGWAFVWDGVGADADASRLPASQFAMTWMRFPGHGHPRAQELSISYWSGAVRWFDDVGYWGDWDGDRPRIEGWDGTNAPHARGEADAARQTRLLGSYCSGDVSAFDAERRNQDGLVLRRQAVQWGRGAWIVLDAWEDPLRRGVMHKFTTSPTVRIESEGTRFVLSDAASSQTLEVATQSSDGSVPRVLRAARNPFAGWMWDRGAARPTDAIVLESAASTGWAVTAWRPGEVGSAMAQPLRLTNVRVANPESWSVELSGQHLLRIERDGSRLRVGPTAVDLATAPDVAQERREISNALRDATSGPSKYRDLFPWRWKASLVVLAIWGAQILVWLSIPAGARRTRVLFAAALVAGWGTTLVFLHSYYFVVG